MRQALRHKHSEAFKEERQDRGKCLWQSLC
jgi:hypothetical protein